MIHHSFQPPTPQHHQRQSSSSKKQYSYSQMKKWCQHLLETHTSQLLQEINQNNEVIKVLSQKIKSLEQQLNAKREPTSFAVSHVTNADQMISIMNNLLNSKLRDIQDQVSAKLSSLESTNHQLFKLYSKKEVENYQNRMESEISSKITSLKSFVRERMDHTVHVNTQHWNKVKQWLKKIESMSQECSTKGDLVETNMSKVEEEINKGLLNLYKVRNFNTRVREVEMAVYDLEESFKNITEYQGEYKMLVEKSAKRDMSEIEEPRIKYFHRDDAERQVKPRRYHSRETGRFQRLSPLQINLSGKEENNVFPYNSFYSDATARKHQGNHQCSKDIQHRLRTLIKEKSLPHPLACSRDQLGYLKNSLNNYIFDLEGNMFKLSSQEFDTLSSLPIGLLKPI